MSIQPQNNRFVWLALGVVVGSLSSGLLPHSPLYASATAAQDGFAIATGAMDNGIEAVFILDSLTGDLKARVINNNPSSRTGVGTFTAKFDYNILKDFSASKSPKFLMCTGVAELPRKAGSTQMGNSVVYIADVSSGSIACYGLTWSPTYQAKATKAAPYQGSFVPLDMETLRTIAIQQ